MRKLLFLIAIVLSKNILATAISITVNPYPANISTSGLDINWSTNIAGTTYIMFGLTSNLELGILNGVGGNTTHTVSITGTNPATIYYAQVFSVSGVDTASSAINVYCTQSLSSGVMKVYFDKSVDTTFSTGTNAIQLPGTVPDTLQAYINRANYSVDIVIYNFTIPAIDTAINNAWHRGVRVRIIYDGGTSNTAIPYLDTTIPKVASPQGSGYTIMHNKFVIIDADSPNPNDPIVWTGSMNWTSQQVNTDDNNVIIFQDQSLARGYTLEFNEMWGDTTMNPDTINSRFGQYKIDKTPHEYIIGGNRVESYFSPSDNTTAHILSTIKTANTDICLEMYSFTRTDLSDTMQNLYNNGVMVMAVMDNSSSSYAAYQSLLATIGNHFKQYSEGGLEHNKYMIVDETDTVSDPLVLTGSHNWSTSAETHNDENTVIVHNKTIANLYYQEFMKRYNSNQTTAGIDEMASKSNFSIYPNPNNGLFSINYSSNQNEKATIKVNDLTGRLIFGELINMVSGTNKLNINLQGLSSGMYFIELNTSGNHLTQKVIIE